MRKINASARTTKSLEASWNFIIDLKEFYKSIKFVEKVSIESPIKEGLEFYDITTLLWIPIKVKHKINEIKKNEKFKMKIYFPFGSGEQSISIEDMGKYRNISAEIKFEMRFWLLDLIIGPILARRSKELIIETFRNVENKINDKIIVGALK